jgi:Ca-activated chloride channel homolog
MNLAMHSETAIGELKAGSYLFPLQAVDVKGEVQGLLYSATVTQTFRNDRNCRLEAVYTFPLPPKAAVHGFKIRIGEREIRGTVKERAEARREYAEAVAIGQRAALMEEERSDIFTTTVGNIGPGEEVVVTFEMSGPMSCFRNRASLRFPLVVGEVFIPGRELMGGSVGSGTRYDTDQVPDASRITPPRLASGARNPVKLSLNFEVKEAGMLIERVDSACHFARIRRTKSGGFTVGLLPGTERMDRAFILEIHYPEYSFQTSLLVDQRSQAFALTVVPPRQQMVSHSRDVVIVLDRSGSMQGWPMIAARQAAARIVDSLNCEDRFAIVTFANDNQHFDRSNQLHPANNFFKMRAQEFLYQAQASGGTQIAPAMEAGLDYLRYRNNRDCHLLLITDGHVGNDQAVTRLSHQGVRISTVGIGDAAREGFLTRIAEVSGGLCSLITNNADLDRDLADLHRKWGQPIWQGLTLSGTDGDSRSPKFWDVWKDVPTTLFGRLSSLTDRCALSGWLVGSGQYSVDMQPEIGNFPLVHKTWARSRLMDLEDLCTVGRVDRQALIKLSIEAQVLCRYTAFSAVDREGEVSTQLEMQTVVQAVERTVQQCAPQASHTMLRSCVLGSAPPVAQRAQFSAERSKGGGGQPIMLQSQFAGSAPQARRVSPPTPPTSGAAMSSGGHERGSEILDILRKQVKCSLDELEISPYSSAAQGRCKEALERTLATCGEVIRNALVSDTVVPRVKELMQNILDCMDALQELISGVDTLAEVRRIGDLMLGRSAQPVPGTAKPCVDW